jgi:hypothetical protein
MEVTFTKRKHPFSKENEPMCIQQLHVLKMRRKDVVQLHVSLAHVLKIYPKHDIRKCDNKELMMK